LQDAGKEVVPSNTGGTRVLAEFVGREYILPAKFPGGVGVLFGEGFGHIDFAFILCKVRCMQL
jgi:hypothetical protein